MPVNLSNYALKSDLKKKKVLIYHNLQNWFSWLKMKCRQFKYWRAKNVPNNLDNLESKRKRWDVEKLKAAPADLKKLGDVADKDVLKTAVYNQLVVKIKGIEGKIPSVTGLFIKSLSNLTVFNNWIC